MLCLLQSGSGYTIGGGSSSIYILDDPPLVSIVGDDSIGEGSASARTFTVQRSGGDPTQALTVQVESTGSATEATDFTNELGAGPFEIIIAANESEATFDIEPVIDSLVEETEAATYTIVFDSEHYLIDEEGAEASVAIIDSPPTLTVTAVDNWATEDNEYESNVGLFQVSRSGGDLSEPLEFSFSFFIPAGLLAQPFYATVGDDFTPPEASTATFAANVTSWYFTLVAVDDEDPEFNEWARLDLTANPGTYVLGEASSATVTIEDNDKWGLEDLFCTCLCGCPGVEMGVVEQLGMLVVQVADGMLTYVSGLQPHPIISVDAPFESQAEGAESIEARLTFGSLTPVSIFYDPEELEAGESYRFSLQVDAATLQTGRHGFSLELIEHYASSADITREYHGFQEIVNLDQTVMGPGFQFTFVDTLAIQTDGVSLVKGNGSQIWFQKNLDGSFTAQAGDPDFSSLEYDDVSETYSLSTRSGVVALFDSGGLLQTRSDTFGNSEIYVYADEDEDELADDLVSMVDFAGRETVFAYADGLLETITDFAGRVTTLGYTEFGQLSEVVGFDPDSEGPLEGGTSSFTYDAVTGLMDSFTRPAGGATELAYNHARALISKTNPSSGVVEYASEATLGVIDVTGWYGGEGDPAALVLSSSIVGSTTSELNEATSYTTDLYGGRSSETNDLGETTQYIRNAEGQVVRLIGPEPSGGVDFQFVQELVYENGNLTSVLNVEGSGYALITEYEYDETWTSIPVSVMSYSGAVSPAETLGWTLFTIDAETGAVTQIRRVLGENDLDSEETNDAVESFTFTAAPEISGDPPAGLLETHTNANGVVSAFIYSGHGLVLTVTQAQGTSAEATVSFEYNTSDDLTAEIDELGRRSEHTYDLNHNRLTTTLPDPDGPGGGNPLESPVLSWQYSVMGKVTLAVDAIGRETEYVYGAFGNLVSQTLSMVGWASSPSWSWAYDAAGRNVSQTDPLSRTTSFTLDPLGRTIVTTLPDPDSGGSLLSPVFEQTFSSLGFVDSSTDALGNTRSVALSDFGRTITTTLADPDDAGPLSAPQYVTRLNLLGQVVEEVDPLGRSTTYSYNMLGRLVEKVLPAPAPEEDAPVFSWTHDANGNILTEVDPLLGTTEFVWDNRDRLVEKHLPEVALGIPTILYVWDDANNLSSLTDPAGNTTSWVVDNLNRVIEETNELDATRFFAYDAAGRLIERGDRNGRIVLLEYDLLDNVTSEKWYTGETLVRELSFMFDAAGQLLSAADPDSAFGFVHDSLGRTTEISAEYAGLTPEIVVAQTFDANSARSQLAVTLGETADFVNDFTRDNLARLTRLEQSGVGGGNSVATKRVDFSYFADSQYDAISRYADLAGEELIVTSGYQYDDLGRLTNLAHMQGETTLASYGYTYDVGSRITSIDSLADGLSTYSYDATSQLTSADHASQTDEEFPWDENGNHAAENFEIGPNNKILSDGTFDYEFDAEGNMILKTNIATGETVAFAWDHRDRLTGVINRDDEEAIAQEVHFIYDVFDRWIARTADDDGAGENDPTSLFFVYDGTQIVLELDDAESETPAHRYLWAEQVDQLLADEDALGDVLYPLADHLNTVRDLAEYNTGTNETDIIDHIIYESFGKVVSESTPTPFRFLFTSRPVDEFTSLQSNWHRWYSVDLGSWLSEDPIGFDGWDANLGRYAGNNPVSHVDPEGLTFVYGPKPKDMKDDVYMAAKENFKKALAELKLAGDLGLAIANYLECTDEKQSPRIRIQFTTKTLPHASMVDVNGDIPTITFYADDDFFPGGAGNFPDGAGIASSLARAVIVLAHEFGHAYFRFKDPENVGLIENPIRTDTVGRNDLRNDYDGMAIPDVTKKEFERSAKRLAIFIDKWKTACKKTP